ncbi:MmgE/PrpD family protein [Salipiger abyssi]|uniref:MmgE/PrpD family protein n=1 Tax=Salipiger abyssi TaxID=1250539 RepID=UPI001A8D102F|nr:MmgE/PrpD family protein [Salipiger abyssi]MBN9887180.1 MmgE/PrpD family protein [Salipiger abyssi]
MPGSTRPSEAVPVPPLTARFAEFAAGLSVDTLEPEVRETARNCLTDWLGVTIAGAGDASLAPLIAVLGEEGGAGVASVFGRRERLPAQAAATVNGAASEIHDYDDTYYPMYGHPSAAPIATALALAEKTGASGGDLLAGVAVGSEISCRLGRLVGYEPYLRGLSPTGTSGAVGAAAAGARVLRLDTEATGRALALGAAQAAGLHASGSSSAMQLQAGRAAGSGVLAAELAARGFTAHGTLLEAPRGFVSSRGGAPDWDTGLDGLGARFAIRDIYFKFAASCGGTQPTIEATERLRAQAMQGEGPREIVVAVSQTVRTLCRVNIPTGGYEAKFSLPFCAAATLLGIDLGALESFDAAVIARPEVQALMARVRVVVEPSQAEWQAVVSIGTASGAILSESAGIPDTGAPSAALAPRIRRKFLKLAAPVLGEARAQEVLAVLTDLETRPAAALFTALAGASETVA